MEDNKDVQVTEETKVEETEKEETTRTYTQEDLDNSFNAGRKKASHDWQKDEKYKEFIEWKENQKTQQDKYDELVKKDGEKDNTISNLQKENEILRAGVNDSDDVEFILYKVGKMEGDFSENLKNYLAENPKYVKKQEIKATDIEKKSSSVEKESGVMAILKARHPERFN